MNMFSVIPEVLFDSSGLCRNATGLLSSLFMHERVYAGHTKPMSENGVQYKTCTEQNYVT